MCDRGATQPDGMQRRLNAEVFLNHCTGYPIRKPMRVVREPDRVAPYKKGFRHGVLTVVSSTLKRRDCLHSIP